MTLTFIRRMAKVRVPRAVLVLGAFTIVGISLHHELHRREKLSVSTLSTQELIYSAAVTWGGRSQVAELEARGDETHREVVASLHRCPLTESDRGRLTKEDVCSAFAIAGLIVVIGELGGIDGRDELRRWLREPIAERRLRELAALTLAKSLHDREILPAIVDLLSLPDRPDSYAVVYRALGEMPAPETAGAIRAALLRHGPVIGGTEEGLFTLASFSTDEARSALASFFTVDGLDWRRAAVRTWEERPSAPMPALVRRECIAALEESFDLDMQRSACRALAGSKDHPRTPELYDRFGSDGCERIDAPGQTTQIVEIVKGRTAADE